MKQLTIAEEGLVDLTSYDIAIEGIFDFLSSKEVEDPTKFNVMKAYDKIKAYSKNPSNFTVNLQPAKLKRMKLCIALNDKAPPSAVSLVVALESTMKKVFVVADKIEKDRIRQASILGVTINIFNHNIRDFQTRSGKVEKDAGQAIMRRVVDDALKAEDTYYTWVGRSVQKEAQGWLGGNPFKLTLKPETGRYRNAGGGKLKAVSNVPMPDQLSLDKLVKVFLRYANPKTLTFDNAALDDTSIKYWVDYAVHPELKSMLPSLTTEQRQAMAIVFSGKSNSQGILLDLCAAMKQLYVSIVVYISECISETKKDKL